MLPLFVQLLALAGFRLAGYAGWLPAGATLVGALRFALVVMFLFTAIAHFLPRTRPDLVRMVPPAMPMPGLPVSVTGMFEMAGAIGLLIPGVVWLAALALVAWLVVLFPANVHAARASLRIAGRRATPLVLRLPLQLFWIGCLVWIATANR